MMFLDLIGSMPQEMQTIFWFVQFLFMAYSAVNFMAWWGR